MAELIFPVFWFFVRLFRLLLIIVEKMIYFEVHGFRKVWPSFLLMVNFSRFLQDILV